MKIVVCGGGIMGASTAYYLATRGQPCTVVERFGLACAASGKAGGFLARDWCDGGEVGPLAQKSFAMHVELGEKFPEIDFRRLHTLSVQAKEGSSSKKHRNMLPDWIDRSVSRAAVMGTPESTAQVHPHKLTHTFMKAARELVGTDFQIGVVHGLQIENGKVTGVKVDGEIMAADVVVIAMGPWSGQATAWIPGWKDKSFVQGDQANSIIFKPRHPVTNVALFTSFRDKKGHSTEVEVYPRPDGHVYVCGSGDNVPLPDDPGVIKPNQQTCENIKKAADNFSSAFTGVKIEKMNSCYLPISPDGIPLIGKVPNVEGAYIATGHSSWGILNAPATGAAIAELIMTGKCTLVDLSPFDPVRL